MKVTIINIIYQAPKFIRLKYLWWKKNDGSSYYYTRQKNLVGVESRFIRILFLNWLLVLFLLFSQQSRTENYFVDKTYYFSIPRQQADLSLTQIAELADITMIFPFDDVKNKIANPVYGQHTVKEGLNILLNNTGLTSIEKGDGRFTIIVNDHNKELNNMQIPNKLTTSLLAFTSAVLASGTTAAQDAQKNQVEELIVIGSIKPVSKLESTNSVTSLSANDIQNFAPRSVADIFTNIPGVQAESVAGDANTNIKVRGLPISAGGSRYLSLQEDGLPLFLIGDYDFATAESYLRFDNTVGSVQSIRGGSGATAAPNSAGGIINFISKTGEEEGGSVGITAGVNYDATRLDFSYGRPLNDGWRFHVGGYARNGEGPREAVDNIESGYQIKANVTKDFSDGFIRFHFRNTDETVPTYLPLAGIYEGGGRYREVGGEFGQSTYYLRGTTPANRFSNGETTREITDLTTGFEVDYTSFGVTGQYIFSDSTTFDIKARSASISGHFVAPFPASVGINASGTPFATLLYFDTKLNSLDSDTIDLSLSHEMGAILAKAGLFHGSQDYDASWHWNTYNIELDGENTPSTDPANPFFNPSGVGGFARAFEVDIENFAPYFALTGQIGDRFSWDASARRDTWDVNGFQINNATDTGDSFTGSMALVDDDNLLIFIDGNNVIPLNYDFSETSWALGGNYSLTDQSALFFSYAQGGSISAPSRTTSNINPDGSIPNSSVVYNEVTSTEVGYKYQADNFNIYATLFDTQTMEASNFQLTTGTFIENSFESTGLELEMDLRLGGPWSLSGTLLYIDAEITASNKIINIGNEPRKQPDTFITLRPQYESDRIVSGVNIQYSAEAFAGDENTSTLGSYAVANYFFNYSLTDNIIASLNINNLFDEVGFTDNQDSSVEVGGFARVTPIVGRTASVSVRYDF